jgi:hypothetical protein
MRCMGAQSWQAGCGRAGQPAHLMSYTTPLWQQNMRMVRRNMPVNIARGGFKSGHCASEAAAAGSGPCCRKEARWARKAARLPGCPPALALSNHTSLLRTACRVPHSSHWRAAVMGRSVRRRKCTPPQVLHRCGMSPAGGWAVSGAGSQVNGVVGGPQLLSSALAAGGEGSAASHAPHEGRTGAGGVGLPAPQHRLQSAPLPTMLQRLHELLEAVDVLGGDALGGQVLGRQAAGPGGQAKRQMRGDRGCPWGATSVLPGRPSHRPAEAAGQAAPACPRTRLRSHLNAADSEASASSASYCFRASTSPSTSHACVRRARGCATSVNMPRDAATITQTHVARPAARDCKRPPRFPGAITSVTRLNASAAPGAAPTLSGCVARERARLARLTAASSASLPSPSTS